MKKVERSGFRSFLRKGGFPFHHSLIGSACGLNVIPALRIISSVAPIRIRNPDGPTWFAEHTILISRISYAEVQVEVYGPEFEGERIVINAENFGERYAMHPETPGWDRHPLIEAAIRKMGVADDFRFQVTIFSEAPGGASTGTSAAVTVALIGALDRLTPGRMTPHEAAYAAHSVEQTRSAPAARIALLGIRGDQLHQRCSGIPMPRCRRYRYRTPRGGNSNAALC